MSFTRFAAPALLLWAALHVGAQEPAEKKIDAAWDSILRDAAPAAAGHPSRTTDANEFLKHFFFESRTEFWRYSTSFTGLATVTGLIDAPFNGLYNPGGIPYSAAFQPDANRVYGFMDWGTRGWLSDRVNTHFAVRYEQDLSHSDAGAPAGGLLETFPSNRRFDVVNASVDIKGRAGDAPWNLELGRQYVYGADMAALDGASFSIDRRALAVTLFGGRRFSFFGDPDQRAIGGANVVFRIGRDASLEYQGLWYIKGENSLALRKRWGAGWLLSSYFRAYGGAPVDFSAQALYSPGDGRTTIRAGYFQKLSNRDYIYDFTTSARYLDSFNREGRLYLGPISPYSQFSLEASRSFTRTLRLGASLWLRRLNNNSDQGPFDTSFRDYRVHANWLPRRRAMLSAEYHQHDSERLPPLTATTFDDVTRSGETSVKDLTGEISKTFAEGKFGVNGGVYYRRVSMQDRFLIADGQHQSGWLTGGWYRLDGHTRIYGDYNLDNDFFLFYPSIRNSRALRVGMGWKY